MKKIHIDGIYKFNVYCHDDYLCLSDEAEVAIYNAISNQKQRYANSRIKEYLHGCMTACFWRDKIELDFIDNYRDLYTYGGKELLYACVHEVADEGDFLICVYGNALLDTDVEIYTYCIDEPVEGLAYFKEDEESEQEDDSYEDEK